MYTTINSNTTLDFDTTSLDAWLGWQEQLHPRSIDLGLERVAVVWQRLQPNGLKCPVIVVGGTNGKGSCATLCASILQAAGYRTGLYTSPHLLRYNERICIDGAPATDAVLCAAFSHINQVRDGISLTYFEFGTLAAFCLFAVASIDVAVLEVGLGGRLDAVNVLDADVALVTTVDIDHTAWLGTDVATIAREKAGIFRARRPAVIGDAAAPKALADRANAIGAQIYQAGQQFSIHINPMHWDWHSDKDSWLELPMPTLGAKRQLDNAAAVLMVLHCLADRLPITKQAICDGLVTATLSGRWQIIPGDVTWILDVAHNPQAATCLAQDLANRHCAGKTHAVFACLADKDALGILNALVPQVNSWHIAQLSGMRARPIIELLSILGNVAAIATKQGYNSVVDALAGAMAVAHTGDRIIVTGSFLTVAAALTYPSIAIKL